MSRADTLTLGQEQALVVATERGDADACRKLVEVFMPAIAVVALRFPTGAGVEHKELHQQGVVGLLLAARRYDPRLNTPFWGYASFWVRKAMQELVARQTRPVALSDRAVRALARIKSARGEYVQAHGTEPTNKQLSKATGFAPTQLETLQAAERLPRGLHEPLRDDAEVSMTIGDTIADPVAERAFERVLDRIEMGEVRDDSGRLDERERTVLQAHFGLGQPSQTLDQIGGTLGLTAERARQIEAGAMSKLRAMRSNSPHRLAR